MQIDVKKLKLAMFTILIATLVITNAYSKSQTMDSSSLIFLEGFDKTSSEHEEICNTLKQSLSDWSLALQAEARCVDINSISEINLKSKTYNQSDIGFYVIIQKNLQKLQYKMMISRIHPDDSTEPETVRWEVKMGSQSTTAISKLIKQYGAFDGQINEHKKGLLDLALDKESSIEKTGDNQYWDKNAQKDISFIQAYQKYENEDKRHKNYLAAGLELAAVMGASIINYYLPSADSNPNRVDWDFSIGSKPNTVRARLNGDAVRFDDNSFRTNRGHFFAGTGYYMFAKSAGLSRTEALLSTFAASSFWEYIAEYREVVSINDQIGTTLGGFILGETLSQMSLIFSAGGNTPMNKVLKSIFHSPREMNNWIQRKTDGTNTFFVDNEDIHPDIWSKLNIAVAKNTSSSGIDNKSIFINGEVISIPMFEKPGQVSVLLTDDVESQLVFEKSANGSMDTFKLFAKTALAAYYAKNLSVSEKGSLEGYNLLIGPVTALEIDQERVNGNNSNPKSDFRGTVHVMGSTLDFIGYKNGLKMRFTLDLYGDFAMIRSWAFESYKANHDVTGVASVLANQDYYYGFGTTIDIKASAEYGRFEVGASLQKTNESMINYKMRFYNTETKQLNPTDQIVTAKAWLVYKLSSNTKLEFDFEKIQRQGSIAGGNEVFSNEIIKTAKLIYAYQ